MQMQSSKRVSSIEKTFREAVRGVLVEIEECSGRHSLTGRIDDLRTKIASLPMPADQRRSALQRIQNTDRYLAAGEKGAAVYELKALLESASGLSQRNGSFDPVSITPFLMTRCFWNVGYWR